MEYFLTRILLHARSIWNYRWYAVAVAWLVAAAGFGVVHHLPNVYQSNARVFVDTQSILKPLLSGMTSVPNVQQQVSIMSRTLLSRPNVERVIRMADLDINATDADDVERQIAHLQSRIKITGTSSQDIYTISYSDHDSALVHKVVQSFLTLFVEGSFKGKRGDSDEAIRFLDQQIAHYETRLQTAENALKEFKVRHAGLLPRQGIDFNAQLAAATDALGAAELELAEAQQTRQALLHQINGGVPGDKGTRYPTLELDARLAEVGKQLETMRMQYTEQHPDVMATRRLLAQLETRRRQEGRRPARDGDPGRSYSPMLQQLKVTLADAEARIAATRVRVFEYNARVQRLRAQSASAPEVEAQLAQLNRDYAVNKEQHEKLIGKREAARLSGDLSSSTDMMTFKIIDPPSTPRAPSGPQRAWLYSMVLLGALASGACAGLIMSHARPTFSSVDELRQITGVSVLGSVAMHRSPAATLASRHDMQRVATAGALLLALFAAMLLMG